MIGLAVNSTSPANIAVLFKGSAPTATTPSVAGPLLFLDLLGFLGNGDLPLQQEPIADEAAPQAIQVQIAAAWVASGPVSAPPKDIADALIRSMLTPFERPVAQEITAVAVNAPPSTPPRVDDWDIPFDWVAPEEPTEPEHLDVGEMPLSVGFDDTKTLLVETVLAPLPVAVPVAVPVASKPLLETNASQTETKVLDPMKAGTAGAPPKDSAPPTNSAPVPTRVSQAAPQAPLVFALKLTAKETPVVSEVARPVALRSTAAAISTETAELQVAGTVPQVKPAKISSATTVPSESLDVPTAIAPESTDSQGQSNDSDEPADSKREPKSSTQRELPAKIAAPRYAPPGVVQSAAPQPAASPGPVHIPAAIPVKSVLAEAPAALASPQVLDVQPKVETPSRPAREIAVRISAPDAAPVDLHVKERGGEVHVAVHTADADLQTSLRQDLGTLVDRLDHSGFRTETLALQESFPRTRLESSHAIDISSSFSTAATTEAQGPNNDSHSENTKDGDTARGFQNQDSGGRQQQQQRRQNSSQHFKWMQEMEEEA